MFKNIKDCETDEDFDYENWSYDALRLGRGQQATSSLFLEGTTFNSPDPIYTLRRHGRLHEKYGFLPSAYRIWMTHNTEYEAAMALVGDWNLWQKIIKTKLFTSDSIWGNIESWREEKRLEHEAESLRVLRAEARAGDVSAAKALLAHHKVKAPVGKPKRDNSKTDKSADILSLASTIK